METDRAVDNVAVARRTADHQCEVLLLDRPGGELLGQFGVGHVVSGDQDRAAGVAASRWTMPGRFSPPATLKVGPKWNCSSPTSVPDQWPRAGWTTMPGGLFTTTTCRPRRGFPAGCFPAADSGGATRAAGSRRAGQLTGGKPPVSCKIVRRDHKKTLWFTPVLPDT